MEQSKKKSERLMYVGALIGFACGIALTYFLLAHPHQKIVGDQYVSMVITDTEKIIRLRNGESAKLTSEMERALPNEIMTMHTQFPNHPATPIALKNARYLYKKYKIAVPYDLQPILNSSK